MEIPAVVDERERERERVTNSGSFPLPRRQAGRRHKILFGVIVTIGIILYAAFNVWVYQASKSGKGLSPATLWQAVSTSGTGFQGLTGLNPVKKQGSTLPESRPKPTPTPHFTGPGKYACDEYGICNNYEDAKRVGCPKTYADPHCLNECGDQKVRCLKPK